MNELVQRFNAIMEHRKPLAITSGLVLCLALGAGDYFIGYTNYFIFYLIPILWVAWTAGRAPGFLAAVTSIFIWGFVDKITGPQYENYFYAAADVAIRFGYFLANVYVMSRLHEALNRARETSRMDYLTGVANSRAFFEMTQVEIHRCRRHQKPLSVAFLDCDNFKEVNDRFGHAKGDEFLRDAAETLKKGLRATDILARVGGDEFAVVLPDANAKDADAIFNRLRSSLNDVMQSKGFNMTMSVGVASFSTPPEEVKDLMEQADEFMYAAKKHGKNRLNIQTIN